MSNKHKSGHKEKQYGGSIFGVSINFACDAHESQQARRLQQSDESRCLQPAQRHLRTFRQALVQRNLAANPTQALYETFA